MRRPHCNTSTCGGSRFGLAQSRGVAPSGPARRAPRSCVQTLDDDLLVRIDADLARDVERTFDDLTRAERRVAKQRLRRRLRVRSARADRDDAVLRLQHIAGAGDDELCRSIGDRQHRFEAPQHAIRPPVFCKLDRRARQMSLMLLELGLEALEQRERVRRCAGESGEDLVVIEAPHLARGRLDDNVPERYLTVAAERDGAIATNRQDRRPVKGLGHSPACNHQSTFLTKCRGEMPMSSSSARTIGVAPVICTAFPSVSIRVIALSSAPAKMKSTRSTSVMSICATDAACATPVSCASCWGIGPASTPSQTTLSWSVGARPVASTVTLPAVATASLSPMRGGGSQDGGDNSNATAKSTARSSNFACSCCHCSSSSDSIHAPSPPSLPRATAASRAATSFSGRWIASSIRWPRARARSAASIFAPASSKAVTDDRSIRARGTHFSSARFRPSSCPE